MAICRVCLVIDVRMYGIINTPAQGIFQRLTTIPLNPDDGKPFTLCYICYAQLQKCSVFINRALKAETLLNQLLDNGIGVTSRSVASANRQACDVLGGLCVSTVEHIDVTENEGDSVIKSNGLLARYESPVKFEKSCTDENVKVVDVNHVSDTDHHAPSDSEDGMPVVNRTKPRDKIQKRKWKDRKDNTDDFSDSDDDVPLKNLSSKQQSSNMNSGAKVRKKGLGRKNTGEESWTEFAREIILSKEEQLEELMSRAKSVNYIDAPLKCELCYKGFIDMRAYQNHKYKHDERSGAHECEVCHMRYATGRKLRTHAATAHARHYACNRCPHRSRTPNLAREHEKWHRGYTYECRLCGHKSRKPTSHLTHMRKRHATQYVCNMCGDSFATRRGLLMHRTKTHVCTDKQAENTEEPASKRFCSECNIEFFTIEAWKRHMLSSVKHTRETEDNLECKICSVLFSSNTMLTLHMREHERALKASRTVPLPDNVTAELACDQCDVHFDSRSKLQAHVKRKHLGLKYNKNVVCEVCGKHCTSYASLKYHQRTHTGERPYQCTVCSKCFADNYQLRIHTRTHTGEQPYVCTACGKRFRQKPALNRHYRVHTGAKPYVCHFCTKSFSQSSSLKLHVRTVHLKIPPKPRGNKVENASQQSEKGPQRRDTVALSFLQKVVQSDEIPEAQCGYNAPQNTAQTQGQ